MQGFTRLFCALLVLAASAFSQAGDDPHAINGYDSNPQGYYFYPGNKAIYTYCAYVYNPANPSQKVYVKGVNVQISIYGWNGTGWHSHEANTGSPQRPFAEYLTPNPEKTGTDGCVTFGFRFPWFSGWYTIEATSTYGRTGVNEYLKYWAGSRLAPVYLTAYPNNFIDNAPQNLHNDSHHSSASRYLLPSVRDQVVTASEQYAALTQTLYQPSDVLDITRGSLPDGGRADNEGLGFTPDGGTVYPTWVPWSVRSGETHSMGVEVDVANPFNYLDVAHFIVAAQSLNANNCPLGALDSRTNTISGNLRTYWGAKDIFHVVCKPNALLKY